MHSKYDLCIILSKTHEQHERETECTSWRKGRTDVKCCLLDKTRLLRVISATTVTGTRLDHRHFIMHGRRAHETPLLTKRLWLVNGSLGRGAVVFRGVVVDKIAHAALKNPNSCFCNPTQQVNKKDKVGKGLPGRISVGEMECM